MEAKWACLDRADQPAPPRPPGVVNMHSTYPSKVDSWVVALLGTVIVFEIGLGLFFAAWTPPPKAVAYTVAAFSLALAGFLAWILTSTEYDVGDGELRARSGPFRFRVPLDAIVGVRPTRNPISSPAFSLDRLQVDYQRNGRKRFFRTSPKDKERFLEELASLVPGLRKDGDRLVARQ